MDFKLRPYQIEAVEAVWKNMFIEQFTLFVGATGSGKTNILIALINKAMELMPEIKICFVVNKLRLLDQTKRRIRSALGDIVSVYSGKDKDLSKQVIVGSIQSLCKRNITFNLVFFDEGHNINQEEGTYLAFVNNSINVNKKIKFISCTATPYRATGLIYGPNMWFKKVVFSKGLKWSIDKGFLVPPSCKRVKEKFDTSKLKMRMGDYDMSSLNELVSDKEKIVAQIEDALPQLVNRKCIIWACINIKHAEAVAGLLTAVGESVSIVHSKQTNEIADENMAEFENGDRRHLVFVTIISEGTDIPRIDSVVLMRPTRSPILYVQTVGRALRPYKNKKTALILDYGSVLENCGSIYNPYINTGKKKNKKGVIEIKMKFCEHCYEYCELKCKVCPCCEEPFPVPEVNLKNLTTKAYGGNCVHDDITLTVTGVFLSTFTAKSGNDCNKIVYEFKEMLIGTVQEFFLTNKTWAFANQCKSLCRLGLGRAEFSRVSAHYDVNNVIINVCKDGKYWKIT